MEITEKYKFFPQKEVTKIDEDGNESVVTISYKIKFVDSAMFMETSLKNFVDNLTERILKIKCKGCGCLPEYKSVKENSIKYKCTYLNKDYSNKIDEQLKKRFRNTFTFSNNDINKFVLLLRKSVYHYECMNDGKHLMKHWCLQKKNFIAT